MSSHRVLSRPGSPSSCSYVLRWCSVCLSTPVHSCHMASPFPPETVSHCHNVFRFGSLPDFSIRHSDAPYNSQYSPFHFPLTSVDHSLFLLLGLPCSGAVYLRPGLRRTARRLSLSLVFWNLSASVNSNSCTRSKSVQFAFRFSSPSCPWMTSVCLGVCIWEIFVISVRFDFCFGARHCSGLIINLKPIICGHCC